MPSSRRGHRTSPSSRGCTGTDGARMIRTSVHAAGPRTLPAAAAPVLVGSGLAIGDGVFRLAAFVAALVGALSLQVAAQFANGASGAVRGADPPDRVGPPRLVAQGV